MNFSCEKFLLLDAVNTVIKTVPTKSSIPVLEGIYIEISKNGRMKLVGADTDISTQTVISIEETSGDFSFVVPAKTFYDMLNKMDAGTIYVMIDDKSIMHMVCGVLKYDLPTMDAELYPETPIVENDKRISIKRNMLISMLKQTVFAASQIDIRPILKGVLFDIKENELTIVASDTFRLALRKETFENIVGSDFSFVVPSRTLNELLKIIKSDDEDEVIIDLASTHIVFSFDNVKMTSRLLAGEFSNYKAIMPKNYKTQMEIKVSDFKKAIERASVLLSEKIKNPVKMSFETESIVISCRTPEGMSLVDEINAKIQGEYFEIGFNDRFMSEILNVIEEENVKLLMNSPLTPMCIKPLQGDKFVYIISPMRITNT